MSGFPIDTAKDVMSRCVENLRPDDTMNMMTFAGSTTILWDKPVENTKANREKALAFLKSLRGGGGTEMMKAINACLGGERDPERTRIVCFMTDAYVGNDMAIVDAVRKNADKARVFSFGIGKSVNRYLLDNMARFGRGEADYALKAAEAEKVARTFYSRIDAPVLTDITIDWGDLAQYVKTDDVYPKQAPDLFSVRPIVVKGRFEAPRADVSGQITIRGHTGEGAFSRAVDVTLPADAGGSPALPQEWARAKVADLMARNLTGAQAGKPDPAIKETILGLGLTYRLMTQYTSFVAVERKRTTKGGKPVTVDVPVEMPEGMSYEGVFGHAGGAPGRGNVRNLAAKHMALGGLSAAPLGRARRPSAATWAAPTPAPPSRAVPHGIPLPKPLFATTPTSIPKGPRPKPGAHRPHGEYTIGKGVKNLALHRPVTASEKEPLVGKLAMVTDGKKEALDTTYVELDPKVQWVQIDLGKVCEIQAIVVWHEHQTFARIYKDVVIQIADDKDFTKNVRTVYNNDHDNSAGLGIGKDGEYFETYQGLLIKLKSLKGRYVRLYSNGSTADDLNRYTEVEVYGK